MRTRLLSTAFAIIALGIGAGRLSAQGATSVCKDGTTSAASGKGACSGHGGVDAKATAAAKKAASSAKRASAATPPASAAKSVAAKKTATASEKDPTDAVAKCKDGTYSHQATHKGACSRHGGVDKFLKP